MVEPNHAVYVISAGRADNVKTRMVCPHAILAVPEAELAAYREFNSEPIIGIPKARDGNPAKARNYCLGVAENDRALFLDDDYMMFGYHEGGRTHIRASRDRIVRFCNQMFDMAEDLGTVLWGINLHDAPLLYRDYSPFSLTAPVLGSCMGILRTDIRFDEEIWLKEDFDFSLQVLNRHRVILRSNKWHYKVDHIRGV